MFPYSDMQHIVLTEPITEKDFWDRLVDLLDTDNISDPAVAAMIQSLAPSENSEHCISGEAYMPRSFLANPGELSSFLHLQSTALMRMDASYFTRRTQTTSYMILYTLSGEGVLEYEGATFYLKSGDGFFLDCQKPHFYRTAKNEWNHCVVHFHGSGATTFYHMYAEHHPPLFHQPLNGAFQKMLEELISLQTTIVPFWEVKIAGALSNLLTFLITETSPAEDSMAKTIQAVIRYMEEHLGEELSLDLLSKEFHISKYHLSREFHKLTSYPPIEYLIQLRLKQAQFLLSFTDLPVWRVAESVGIPNEQYFGKLFKKRFSMTPGQYRKQP